MVLRLLVLVLVSSAYRKSPTQERDGFLGRSGMEFDGQIVESSSDASATSTDEDPVQRKKRCRRRGVVVTGAAALAAILGFQLIPDSTPKVAHPRLPGDGECDCGWSGGGANCGESDGSECYGTCCGGDVASAPAGAPVVSPAGSPSTYDGPVWFTSHPGTTPGIAAPFLAPTDTPVAAVVDSGAASQSVWSFPAKVNGVATTLYAIGERRAQDKYLKMEPTGYTINGMSRDGASESRFYVVKKKPEWEGNVIKKDVLEPWKLGVGSVVSVKMTKGMPDDNDCNGAYYLIGMPGETPGTNNDWYCDANSVGGNTCWEQDIVESTTATVSTSHASGDGGGQGYANGGGFHEATIIYRDGMTIDAGDVGSGTGAELGAGNGAAIATSIWYCGGWPGMPPSSPERCSDTSTVSFTEWEITESA